MRDKLLTLLLTLPFPLPLQFLRPSAAICGSPVRGKPFYR